MVELSSEPAGVSPRGPDAPDGSPLRTRLFLLSAAAILPLAVMAGLGLEALRQEQTEQAERVGLELSRSVANSVDAELRGAIAVLETLATSPTLDGANLDGFRARAERVVRIEPRWAAIILSSVDGTTLMDTRAEGTPRPLTDRESFDRVLRTGEPAAGDLTRGPDTGWFVPVRVPVRRDGAVAFLVTAIVTPEAILDVLVRQQLPPDWVISIVDANGLRVARSRAHEENLGGRLSESVEGVVVGGGGREGFGIAYTLEGERIFTPYSRLPGGWHAVLGLPTALTDAAVNRAILTYGGGSQLSLILGALGAHWMTRTVTRPIDALRRAAEAVGRRELPAQPITSIREINQVAAALRAAAADLARVEAEREDLLRRERDARETAEAADRAKDEFLAVLSHELRTPLNAVFGWAKMLQSGHVRDQAMSARATDAIVRNADAQVRLIDDLLDLSRIASGKLRLDIRRVELSQLLRAAVDAVRPVAETKAIRIRTSFDPDAGAIDGDPGRIQQIVWNLLDNAVKFNPNGGEVELSLERAGPQVRIVVRDSGQGIAPEILPYVFERFRQADSSSTREQGGLGLGLALVKHLAALHGGAVTADSQGLGAGATFTVTLPAAIEYTPGEAPVPSALALDDFSPKLARLDGVRALVVDDDDEGLTLAEAILSRAGAEVRSCRSAPIALDLLRAWRPDVLVSDIEMPGEDGYSLIRSIRTLAVEDGGATPAIALTAYGRPQDRAQCLVAGFDMHVPKPVDPGELTAIVAGVAGAPGEKQAM
jgi:signal transduction histidine kinase/ActR/RegA family two-component response regulator